MREGLLDLLDARRGHFRYESGHHGELWLDLDALFARPAALAPYVDALAAQLAGHDVGLVCGPLTGGAFVAYQVAHRLGVRFRYSERVTPPSDGELYSARYELRGAHDSSGLRVAVLDDVVNAGSAVGSTLTALREAGTVPVAVGALLVLGASAAHLTTDQGLALEAVVRMDNTLWEPTDCPHCAAGSAAEALGN